LVVHRKRLIMKNLILLLSLSLAVSTFWSCEKENVAPAAKAVVQESNPTDVYLANVNTKVLFASLQIDHEAELVSAGWLLNDKGELRKITNEFYLSLRDEIVTEKTINSLHHESELVKTINKDELVDFHKKSTTISYDRAITTNSEETASSAYISYQALAADGSHDCSDDYNSSATPVATFQQNLLVATGQFNQTHSTELIKTVNEYLTSLEKEIGN